MVNHPNRKKQELVATIKGFGKDFTCCDFKFEIGKSYEHTGAVKVCKSGFHACEYPLDVFQYYPPNVSRYAAVEQSGKLVRHDSDSKVASAKISIQVELSLSELIERAVKWIFERSKPEGETATGESGAASATRVRGAASATGVSGAASATGVRGAASATGVRGAASATGVRGAASATGESGAASATGVSGAASATGESGAASATGVSGAASATGVRGAASATGWSGAASATGWSGAASATGESGAASATGWSGRVMGAKGCALFLVYREPVTGDILHVWAGIAGKDGIKPLQWYSLSEEGKPVKV